MGSDSNKDEKTKIVLNRKMRMWNMYKNYVIIAVAILVVIILFSILLKSCGNKDDKKNNTQTTTIDHSATEEATNDIEIPTQKVTEEPTTVAVKSNALEVDGTASAQDYTSKTSFTNSLFIGDFIVSGISGYGYLPDAQVIASNSMTSDRLADDISTISSRNPDSVFIMVGLNDLNYGTRTPSDIYDNVSAFVGKLKTALPNAKIYIVSTMPVTKSFENSNGRVKQSDIDALNDKFKENSSSIGITYIDVAKTFKDGSDYLGTSYTDNGYNIRNAYYPFIMNGIAGVIK